MNLFDSHCHLENEGFQNDLPEVMQRMAQAGVRRCVLGGSDLETSRRIVALAKEHEGVYGAVGVHPHEAKTWTDETEAELEDMLTQPRVVAVGEIGLDYFYDLSPRDQQREVLIKQLALARRMNVPAVFHVRDAHGDMLEVLRERRGELPAGVMHCYSGSVESAKEYLDLGFYLSFAGPVTFKNAHKLQEAARFCPADRLLVETDSPYLTPVPLRGKRNEPAFVQYVAEVVAQLRGVSTEKLADTAARNACRLFGHSGGMNGKGGKPMRVRPATEADLEAVLLIYEGARRFMAQSGNPGQWGTRYPSRETVEADIAGERCYVCEEEGRLYAAFVLVFGEDPTYRVIDGAWKNDRPYATLHRVASSGEKRGMVDVIVKWAFSRHPNLRGDTHERNLPMRRAFERNGFERCGTIWVEDGTPRIAYQKEG